MKKIYLVKAYDLEKKKILHAFINEVFTNRKLAEAYVKYWNNVQGHKYRYWINEREICKADYRDLVKVNF